MTSPVPVSLGRPVEAAAAGRRPEGVRPIIISIPPAVTIPAVSVLPAEAEPSRSAGFRPGAGASAFLHPGAHASTPRTAHAHGRSSARSSGCLAVLADARTEATSAKAVLLEAARAETAPALPVRSSRSPALTAFAGGTALAPGGAAIIPVRATLGSGLRTRATFRRAASPQVWTSPLASRFQPAFASLSGRSGAVLRSHTHGPENVRALTLHLLPVDLTVAVGVQGIEEAIETRCGRFGGSIDRPPRAAAVAHAGLLTITLGVHAGRAARPGLCQRGTGQGQNGHGHGPEVSGMCSVHRVDSL